MSYVNSMRPGKVSARPFNTKFLKKLIDASNRVPVIAMAQEDSGVLFWEQLCAASAEGEGSSPLKALFSSPLGYSYTAFRQATLLYEEALGDVEFEA
ncbi:hypothetical protein N7527_011223 [Penicillium freii]|nr:hypothetical protein N7527_011223 [Penicillium freii]